MVHLNRPEKHNTLNAELVEALIEVVNAATAAQVNVLGFQGEGRCFSAGFDMSDIDSYSDGDLLLRFAEAIPLSGMT
ncbi:enoyl-CoA hydratase/isomerase family protein [Pseudomonas putida]|nr:enoyl-CoA hydratase/isomerase family protein [Pseudomonas putida]